MSKRTRINLTVVVTLILVLAAAVPALAKLTATCGITTMLVHVNWGYKFITTYGELDAYWEDGVLYNICTGTTFFDEEYNTAWRYATLEEVCEYFGDRVTCTQSEISTTQDQWGSAVSVYDPDTREVYPSTYSSFTANANSGKFLFYKEYDPTP